MKKLKLSDWRILINFVMSGIETLIGRDDEE
jgi:hypothetical protein